MPHKEATANQTGVKASSDNSCKVCLLGTNVTAMQAAETKMSKLILDLCKVSETNVSLIKLIISTMQRCQTAKVPLRVVASSKQGEELKSFQETSDIPIANTIEEARAGLS